MAAAEALALALPSAQPLLPSLTSTHVNLVGAASSAASWVVSHKLKATAIGVLGVPIIGALQALAVVMHYRSNHGGAPCPIVPSSGTVRASLADNRNPSRNRAFDEASTVQSAESHPPLKLLVIGDSLAAGVGTLHSCTPVFPQTVAAELSKGLNGRPIHWTAMGEPGASAGWIARTLDDSFHTTHGDGRVEEWIRDRLDGPMIPEPSPRGQAAALGEYDVAIVLTGSNDLKMAVLPFLFRQERRSSRRDFASELRDAIDAVKMRMRKVNLTESLRLVNLTESFGSIRTSIEEGYDTFKSSLEQAMPEAVADKMRWANMTRDDGLVTGVDLAAGAQTNSSGTQLDLNRNMDHSNNGDTVGSSERRANQSQLATIRPRQEHPLVVLPALPAKVLSISRLMPLRFFAFPLLNVIEHAKKRLAALYPDSILFVDAPSRSTFDEYRIQHERLFGEENDPEGTIRIHSENDVSPFECELVLQQMEAYKVSATTSEEPFLAADGIHPSDSGYDCWASFIASGILEAWADSADDAGGGVDEYHRPTSDTCQSEPESDEVPVSAAS